ncbi:MAG: HlyC/CorC family transporter [Lachnospiraceae bacterium]|nr:HlyC/CorC family transporter [Lachnospiraceae bacterium]
MYGKISSGICLKEFFILDTQPFIQGAILLILLILSGFFSSAETALVSVNHIQVQLLADEGNKRAERVLWILERSPKMLSAILIGNNIVNLSASALAAAMTTDLFGSAYIGIATGILTFLVLVFGEVTPKSLAATYSLKFSLAYSWLVKTLMILFTPLVFIIDGIRKGILRMFGIDPNAKVNTMTEEELKTLVDVAKEEDAIEEDEFQMINNVFSLDESLAKDIMVPRIDMVFVQADMDREELMAIFRVNQYTRYPVYSENRDNVIGTINMKDVLLLPDEEDFTIRQILREPNFTFEHIEVGTLLMEMREKSINLMIVLDEYGSTSGMITLEDILEEIVGEIRDEYDEDEKDAIKQLKKKNEFLVDGATNLDDVNDMLGLEQEHKITSEEYDSIGGFMIEQLDRLPKKGECIELPDGIKLIAEVVRRNRIENVHIILPEEKEQE